MAPNRYATTIGRLNSAVLERGRARGHQHDIRGRERAPRLPVEHAIARAARCRARCGEQIRSAGVTIGAMHETPETRASNSAAPANTRPAFRLRRAAARQHGEHARPGSMPSARARGAIRLERNLVGERMPDERGAHAVLAVEVRLERETGTARESTDSPMVRTRPCRHAHTCGLTYCTVRRPARLSCLASPG
jgi:hypothetical protein